MRLHLCASCRRHVREDESACPFCGEVFAAPTAPTAPRTRPNSRGTLLAIGLVAATRVTDVGCTNSDDPGADSSVPVDTGVDANAPVDTGVDANAPVDSGTDSSTTDPDSSTFDPDAAIPIYDAVPPRPPGVTKRR